MRLLLYQAVINFALIYVYVRLTKPTVFTVLSAPGTCFSLAWLWIRCESLSGRKPPHPSSRITQSGLIRSKRLWIWVSEERILSQSSRWKVKARQKITKSLGNRWKSQSTRMGDQLEKGATYIFEKEVDLVTANQQASALCLERSWSTSCWVVPSHLQIHEGHNIGWSSHIYQLQITFERSDCLSWWWWSREGWWM